jgi:hypothetical protein
MTDVSKAMELLGVAEKWLEPFGVTDPFSKLWLEGYLSLKPDFRYGALALLKVEGKEAPQRILATPKLHYPFDRTGAFHFPSVKQIDIYEKIDGTNIFVYQFKCKPESVEAIHWKGGINKAAVMATCWNLLETEDFLEYGKLERLLLEEYSQAEIDAFLEHIETCIAIVSEELNFRNIVLEAYDKIGINLASDKASVMRKLSTEFPKTLMKKVFTLISRYGDV